MDFLKNDLSKERILITGGCGFIGHHIVLTLRKINADVLVVDNLGHNNLTYFLSSREGLPVFNREVYLKFLNYRLKAISESGAKFFNIDSRNMSELQKVFNEFKPTKIIHLAAIANARTANLKPDITFDNSVETLRNILECIRLSPEKIDQLVYFSSSMIYGDFPPEGVYEDSPTSPKGVYGALKLCAEQMVLTYHRVYNMEYTIVRPSALYGPRCVSRRVGQVFIENAIAGKTLAMEGDGEEKLDFTYIEDLVQGVLRILDRPEAKNQTFNLTFGDHRSIKDLVGIIKQHFPDVQIANKERDRLRPFRGTLKIDKARKLLGYDPQFPLEKGLPKYIEWYKEFLSK